MELTRKHVSDIKAAHLWEKFNLIFPDVAGRINSYSRKGNVLFLYTSSKNKLIFLNVDNEWCLCTDKFFTGHVGSNFNTKNKGGNK